MSEDTINHLPHYRVRPRFKFVIEQSMQDYIENVRVNLKKQNECVGKVDASHIALSIPIKEQHYWSPQLSITFDKTENGNIVRGVYGPNPAVWTMFVFIYGVIAFAALVVGVIGFSQISLGKPAPILWALPGLIIAFTSMFAVSYFGQKKGEAQMVTLHQFLEDCTGFAIDDDHCI